MSLGSPRVPCAAMRIPSTPALLLFVSTLTACGSSTPPPSDSPQAPAGPAKASTDGQRKLAHFQTADGTSGFTLDRSTATLKLQVDGTKDIVELTQREKRDRRGELVGYELVDPTNEVRVVLSTGGSVSFFRGRDELPATADKDAAPLGEPTLQGPPVEKVAPPAAWEKLAGELKAISVRSKMPELDAKDSADLAKVETAFAKADASMFVHYVKPGPDGWVARAETVPSNFSGMAYGGGDFATDDDEAARHKTLVQHGIRLIGVSSPERDLGNHILLRRSDKRDELADKTPGLVWETDGSRLVLVTFDGGRYTVDLNQGGAKGVPIERGAGPESGWPAPLQDTYADITVVSSLVKAGVHPQKTVDELEAIDGEWNTCVAKAWKPLRIKTGVNQRAEAVRIHKGCSKVLDKLDKTVCAFIDERSARRKALHDKAAARAKQVGATK